MTILYILSSHSRNRQHKIEVTEACRESYFKGNFSQSRIKKKKKTERKKGSFHFKALKIISLILFELGCSNVQTVLILQQCTIG